MTKSLKAPWAPWQSRVNAILSAIFCALVVSAVTLNIGLFEATAQDDLRFFKQQRKQERTQKRIDRQSGNKIAQPDDTSTNGQPETAATKDPLRSGKHSLDGISKTGNGQFINRFFTREELQLRIPGFGRQPALLVILRQLDLTEDQKQKIRAIGRRVGNQLNLLRQRHTMLESELADAIYGENFDPNRVMELSTLVGEKQAELTKLQASIEADFRQILTPDQFFVFHFLVGEMLLPQRRVQPNQIRQQMERRIGQPNNQQP